MSDAYFPWTAEAQAYLARLFDVEGKSYADCADALEVKYGVSLTRSSVSSQVAKLRKKGMIRPKGIRTIKRDPGGYTRTKKRIATATRQKAKPAPVVETPPHVGKNVSWDEWNGKGCRHIDGDPRETFTICGAWTIQGSPYCITHHRVCYRPTEKKEAKAA